jgi:hypothetical protein
MLHAALDTQCMGMNQEERLFMFKAELARILGVDPRSKEVKSVEPSAYLAGTRNRRIELYTAALAESLKERQQEASKRK